MTRDGDPFRIYPDADSLARAAAEHIAQVAAASVTSRGRFCFGLAGGTTPRATYRRLAAPPLVSTVDWHRVHLFWGDERCVAPDHEESNYRMVRRSLLDHVPIPDEQVHRVHGEWDPARATADYERRLTGELGADRRLDLVLLGMGEDGHTASLFPGSSALEERTRSVAAVYVTALDSWRITLTLPVINAARQVVFLTSGAAKARALAGVRGGEPLPAGQVRPTSGRLLWLVDRDAAGLLADGQDSF